jgi:transcriptional regulator with XRE-family HTH domain
MSEGLPSFSFGMRLRMARFQSHLSCAQLARPLGVSVETVSAWEQDRKFPKNALEVAEKWAEKTDVDKHWLAFGEVLCCRSCGDLMSGEYSRKVIRSA